MPEHPFRVRGGPNLRSQHQPRPSPSVPEQAIEPVEPLGLDPDPARPGRQRHAEPEPAQLGQRQSLLFVRRRQYLEPFRLDRIDQRAIPRQQRGDEALHAAHLRRHRARCRTAPRPAP